MVRFLSLLFFLFWSITGAVAGTPAAVEKGRQLYLSYGCALCHGWDARGDGINAQKFVPPPTDFYDLKTYHHGSDWDSMRRSIEYGIKEDSSIMPAFEHVPPKQVNQIITYLQSLQASASVRHEGQKKK
ncbi:MAG: cytochrome c [Candidatus Omnitrophica bacterium]|nr:cytochrome c [Candidatus Omnitrophota bacterium]MDE2008912.1 cytochrome c [Candidatus Omnitrophota bacterium]MDE2213525.1 cytochrome c [Candidatus Omnitrophota bacterium]MDE2230574.1 cytochrome c [Candidatus Omnitrophota bacterium]